MKALLTIIFFISSISLSAQTIVWESEYRMSGLTTYKRSSVIKDSDNNFTCVFEDASSPFNTNNFIKYSPEGSLVKYSGILEYFGIIPVSIVETPAGYRVFCCGCYYPNSVFMFRLPVVINTDRNGELVSESVPYTIDYNVPDRTVSFNLDFNINNVTLIGSNYCTGFQKDEVQIDENTFSTKNHIILCTYDSTGKVVWRKGVDTAGYDAELKSSINYRLGGFTKGNDNNFITLCQSYSTEQPSGTWANKFIKIYISDVNGDSIKRLEIGQEKQGIYPVNLTQLKDGSIVIVGFYQKRDDVDNPKSGSTLWKIEKDGSGLKKVDIANSIHFVPKGLVATPDGGFLVYGRDTYFDPEAENNDDDSIRSVLLKYNSEMETIFDFRWMNFSNDSLSGICNIYNLDEKNIIVSGYKDRYKFYIAKINLDTKDVKEQPVSTVNVTVTPQPFRDICEVTVENASGLNLSADIYDALGNMVLSLNDEQALSDRKSFLLNGSNFAPGVYFLEVRTGREVIRKKILKAE